MTPRVQKKIIVIQIKSFFYYTINGWYFECETTWRSTAMGIRGCILGNKYSVPRSRGCSTDAERSRHCNSDTEISGLQCRSRDLGIAFPELKCRCRDPGTVVPMPRSGNTVPVPRSCPGPVISGL